MTAERGTLSDCTNCQSAGSVRAGRCEICEWEAPMAMPVQLPTAPDRDGGTLTKRAG